MTAFCMLATLAFNELTSKELFGSQISARFQLDFRFLPDFRVVVLEPSGTSLMELFTKIVNTS